MSGPAKRKASEAVVDIEDAVESECLLLHLHENVKHDADRCLLDKRRKVSRTADTTEDAQSESNGEIDGAVEGERVIVRASMGIIILTDACQMRSKDWIRPLLPQKTLRKRRPTRLIATLEVSEILGTMRVAIVMLTKTC